MDKPSDYGSDIRGSNPLGGTSLLHTEINNTHPKIEQNLRY